MNPALGTRTPPDGPLPTGIVAFWFSDIEGSTQRWERFGSAMRAALRRHDELVRREIEAHRGYVFKTIGDAFCAAFWNVCDAAAAAIAVQRGLASEDFTAVDGLRVRIALHCGQADERDGDYFGSAVNRVARLLAVAHGGQTILSSAATQLLGDAVMPGGAILALGMHHLKDIASPESVGQLVAPDLPRDFPPLRSLVVAKHNLPLQLVPLIGRLDVVAEIETLVAQHRLVALVGAGGIGKTRTALHVGAALLGDFEDGVWYVELAALAGDDLVARTIASTLSILEQPGRDPLDALLAFLHSRRLLVVLDNCEHLVAEAARAVDAIVRHCPRASVLATSREPLHIAGERTYRMPSLSVPVLWPISAADAMTYEAVQLFVERASAVAQSFRLTDANASIVADICRRLDGIALAIELAAARIRVLPPAQLAAKLQERFQLLTGGSRERLPRQQTLHAMIAWSYELLAPIERAVLHRIAVFVESWTLEAAIETCTDADVDEFVLIEAIVALAEKSLLSVEGEDDLRTYRLLESTRAFALLALERSGEAERWKGRHAAHLRAVVEGLDALWPTTPTRAWEPQVWGTIADARAAITWALHDGHDVACGIAIVANLRWFWNGLAPHEGRREVAAALAATARVETNAHILGRLRFAESVIAQSFDDRITQYRAAAAALEAYRGLGDAFEEAIALRSLGHSALFLGKMDEAVPLLESALATLRANGRTHVLSLTLDSIGVYRFWKGDARGAAEAITEAIAVAEETGFERGLLFYEINLAEIEFAVNDLVHAIALAERAVRRTYAAREAMGLAMAWGNLAMYYAASDRFDDAAQAARESLRAAQEVEGGVRTAFAIQTLALRLAVAGGDCMGAARLLGYVDARLETFGADREFTENQGYERLVAMLQAALSAESLATALEEGRGLSEASAFELADVPHAEG